jgi:hypothetical protein
MSCLRVFLKVQETRKVAIIYAVFIHKLGYGDKVSLGFMKRLVTSRQRVPPFFFSVFCTFWL